MVNNNQWAISAPRSMQTAAETLAQKAIAAGIPGVQVDGNDVIAVRHGVGQAIARARAGEGPSVVEALTYRMSDHTTADDASRYRSSEAVSERWAADPVARLRTFLAEAGVWSKADEERLIETINGEIDAAVERYLATRAAAARGDVRLPLRRAAPGAGRAARRGRRRPGRRPCPRPRWSAR